ncbi:uncharacterized protein LOC117063336 [Trachypithecus francoisi]|uniref:uncharacterized protein LOC117063336 n=1 Tax=Trachypithecus francoisi TaxID=54180 RepID=UPI00141AA763|nr:uncharacterized protein LOC117063336 [Trachypithecus francoisi]
MDRSAWERGRGWQAGVCAGRGGRGHQLAPSPAPACAWPFRAHLTPDTEVICPGIVGKYWTCGPAVCQAPVLCVPLHICAPLRPLGAAFDPPCERAAERMGCPRSVRHRGLASLQPGCLPRGRCRPWGPRRFGWSRRRGKGVSAGGGAVGAVTRPRAAGKNAPLVLPRPARAQAQAPARRCRGICLTLSGACL